MRYLAATATLSVLIALVPASAVVAQDVAAETAATAQPIVRVLDPGGEPRRELRYHLEVGQTDRSVATTSVASRVQPAEPTWPEPLTLRATTDRTVVGADGDGVFHLETVYTEVELISGGDDRAFADDSAQVRALAGTTTRQSVDERGRVLSSETIIGPDWAAAGIHLGVMPGLIDVENLQVSRLLPDEPVGVGASWQVTSEVLDVEGQPLPVVVTTTLERLGRDGAFELSSEGRIGPVVQRLTSSPTSEHVVMTIRTTGVLSAMWKVDPAAFGPEGRLSVELAQRTTPTAKGVEPWTIALRMTTDTQRLAAPSTTAAGGRASQRGRFVAADALNKARAAHTATVLHDGRVLVVGGEGPTENPLLAEIWDPTTGMFSPAGNLQHARTRHTATLLPDGRVLVVGGFNGRGAIGSAEIWDPTTEAFTPAGKLGQDRAYHTATLLPDGRVLVIGGSVGDPALTSMEAWDPSTETFAAVGDLRKGRSLHTATLLPDGRVLVVGGADRREQPITLAEVVEPEKGTSRRAGQLATGRMEHTASLLPDGGVLVVGGTGRRPWLAAVEVWDPETRTFGPGNPLARGRTDHTATTLSDGSVLIVGGKGRAGGFASALLWDPDAASFGPAGTLREARASHTASLLPDGRVLVVGGVDGWPPSGSAEVWERNGG